MGLSYYSRKARSLYIPVCAFRCTTGSPSTHSPSNSLTPFCPFLSRCLRSVTSSLVSYSAVTVTLFLFKLFFSHLKKRNVSPYISPSPFVYFPHTRRSIFFCHPILYAPLFSLTPCRRSALLLRLESLSSVTHNSTISTVDLVLWSHALFLRLLTYFISFFCISSNFLPLAFYSNPILAFLLSTCTA